MEFKDFQFHPLVAAGVKAAGYDEPTPIQVQAIPSVMQGRDVMGLAQTGTGKTAVFALPILHRLMQGGRRKVRALVIAPTRELAEQIHEHITGLGRKTGLRSVTIYGGVSINRQFEKLHRGVEIIVACPGRLLDHINQGTIDLSQIEVLVLDEADRMFDMGFLPDIRKIIKHVPTKRQTLTGFDYKKQAPARDIEFARPPHEPQRRREQKKQEPSNAPTAAVALQKGHQVQPARWATHRSFALQHSPGSTTHKNQAHKPVTGR